MTDEKGLPTAGYDGDGNATIYYLKPGEKLPAGVLAKPPAGKHPNNPTEKGEGLTGSHPNEMKAQEARDTQHETSVARESAEKSKRLDGSIESGTNKR